MINLKLAEYKDGKFERFLELGKDFGYFGDSISVYHEINIWNEECRKVYRGRVDGLLAAKDEKDPLNRFDGLFDGRTYGEGRFVLIENNQDDIYKCQIASDEEIRASYRRDGFYTWENRILIGNLHKNPELFLKI